MMSPYLCLPYYNSVAEQLLVCSYIFVKNIKLINKNRFIKKTLRDRKLLTRVHLISC